MTVMPPSISVAKRPMSTQLCGSVTAVTFPVCGRSLQDAKVPVPPGVGEAAWDCTADRIALGRSGARGEWDRASVQRKDGGFRARAPGGQGGVWARRVGTWRSEGAVRRVGSAECRRVRYVRTVRRRRRRVRHPRVGDRRYRIDRG